MSLTRQPKLKTILNAVGETGAGGVVLAADHRNIIVSIEGAGSTDLTVKCQGGIGSTAPDFDTAKSATNPWDYLQMIDLEDGASIPGDTGVVFAGSADVRQFEVNTNGMDYITFNVTAFAAGTVTVRARLVTNA
jgi:hypothetical protein